MNIDKYINDGQDPKTVEKLLVKLQDLLISGEVITYIAIQKKPGLTLLPDSIALSNKRIFLSEFTKLGLATNFEILTWKDVKDVAFKEEIFGGKFTVIPANGENLSIDYIPKTQVRRLYQLTIEALAVYREQEKQKEQEKKQSVDPPDEARHRTEIARPLKDEEVPVLKEEKPVEDEVVVKLQKLKYLFDNDLISQAEYDNKKNEILSQF